MESERKLMTDILNSSIKDELVFIKEHTLRISKKKELSQWARSEGNRLFTKKHHNFEEHEEIWQKYSMSTSIALNASEEQAMAYGNRSAFLFHLCKFQECIDDVDRALSITGLNDLKVKLLCRKAKCLVAIDSDNADAALRRAEFWMSKLNKETKDGEVLLKCINSAKSYIDSFDVDNEMKKKKPQTPEVQKDLNDFSLVTVKHNAKYGYHLVATQDIKPGEVIFVEKPYVSVINLCRAHAYCSHCFSSSFAMIPCDSCSWCMFCSEECKKEAWEQYHDFECTVFPDSKTDSEGNDDDNIQLTVRSLIIGFRKAGSMAKFKEELKSIHKDKNADEYMKNFFNNGQFQINGLKCLYCLDSNIRSANLLKLCRYSLRMLIAFALNTTLFGSKLTASEFKKSISNEDIIFIASLILRLMKISEINTYKILNDSTLPKSLKSERLMTTSYMHRGICIAPVTSRINHSCNPNASKCFTEDNKIVVYALQPIKKDSQIFITYFTDFSKCPYSIRRDTLLSKYNFSCDCVPCRDKWPKIKLEGNIKKLFTKPLEKELFNNNKNLIKLVQKDMIVKYTKKMIEDLAKGIEKSTEKLTDPSIIKCQLISTLEIVFERLYGARVNLPYPCKSE